MIKVLHIVESFDGQAIERWLTLLVSESVKSGNGVDWTFYCIGNNAGRYSAQITDLGFKVLCSPYPISKAVNFIKALRETIRAGDYDIIHSHHDLMGAMYFMASIGLPVRKRVMHVHNTSLDIPATNRLKQLVAKAIFRFLCNQLADQIVGVSRSALNSFLDGKHGNEKCAVIHCAIDIESSIDDNCSNFIREDLGIPGYALILLFVGRMTAYKNPTFVIEVLSQLRRENQDVYGVFVGSGGLIQDVLDASAIEGVADRVRCLGWRDDVLNIMAASDVLIFPSIECPMEGLGLSVVEAQSVGLTVVMSLSVPQEAIVIPDLVERLPLQAGAKVWASKALSLIRARPSRRRDDYKKIVSQSSFAPKNSLSSLLRLYQSLSD